MIYKINICNGSQVFNAGTGGPSLWISLNDPVGTFRVGTPHGNVFTSHVPHYGIDDAWHRLEESQDVFSGTAWWVRHISWTQAEVEYRI
jgi:hypothetical protein